MQLNNKAILSQIIRLYQQTWFTQWNLLSRNIKTFHGVGFSADVKTFRSLQMNWIWNKSETIDVNGKCFSTTIASFKITQYKFVITLTKLWIEMTAVTSVVMKAQPIPPIIWPSIIIWRSDLMRAFHYFFFQRRDYTYTLQKEKDWKKTDKGKLSESVTWGAWGDTGNTFLFSFTKNGTLKKKMGRKFNRKCAYQQNYNTQVAQRHKMWSLQ